jgi:putative transposase
LIPEEKRVYLDECGIDKHLQRERGRALCGVRVEDVKRGRKFQRMNVIAGYCCGKFLADWCYPHTTNSEWFEFWFKEFLIPAVAKYSTIILDRASFHREKQLRKLLRWKKIKLLFLPAYSPDFNPIEPQWANLKRALPDIIPKYKMIDSAIYEYFELRNY